MRHSVITLFTLQTTLHCHLYQYYVNKSIILAMFQSSLDEVLHEVDDLDQEPGEDEIREYAELIGIDPDNEPDLLWIARAGITAPLPADWKPIQVNNGDELYFYNFKTGESSWEHPSDDKYRHMVSEERKKVQQKPKNGVGSLASKPPAKPLAATPTKPTTSSAAAAATAALRPLKQPPPPHGPVGKLAPIGVGAPSNPGAPPGKLQPIAIASIPAPVPKPSGKTLAPIGATGQELDRPKTSRGPMEKEKAASDPQPSQKPAVLGGGSRFLKKNDDEANANVAAPKEHKIVQNVLSFPSDESESESVSSFNSASLTIPGLEKEKLVLDLDELKPASDPAITDVAKATKPPVAPKAVPTLTANASDAKSQTKVEPSKPPVQVPAATVPTSAPVAAPPQTAATSKPATSEKPKSQPAPSTVANESAWKTSSDTSESIDKVERQLQEQYERQVKQLREQHDAKLKDVRSKFEEEEKKELDRIKRAMDDRIKSHKEKLQKDEDSETNFMTTSHKKQLDELRSKLDNERADLEKLLRSKLQADLQDIEKEIDRKSIDRRDSSVAIGEEKSHLEVEHKKAMDSLKIKFDKELQDEERKHGTEKKRRTDEMRDRLQKELDDWYRKEKERKIAMLKNDIERELADLKRTMEAERRAGLESEVTSDFERRRREMKEEHERHLKELRREHEAELSRIRRKNTEAVENAVVAQQRQSDRIRGETFDDLRRRQDDALMTAEQQLKSFREELSALTRMTVDIRQTLQPVVTENGAAGHSSRSDGKKDSPVKNGGRRSTKKSDKNKANHAKAAIVQSIDDLLLPDAVGTNGEHSSRATSSISQKLEGLESEDVLEKVSRFLESQTAATDQHNHRTQSLHRQSSRRDEAAGPADIVPAIPMGSTRSMNGSVGRFQSHLQALERASVVHAQRTTENMFRIQPKDAVDDFLDRKVKDYFQAQNAISTVPERTRWMPSGVSTYQTRYFNNYRRGFDVESELNSLKRWLNEFENRVSEKVSHSRSSTIRPGERSGVLPIEATSNGNQGLSFLDDEEVVNI